MIGILTSTRCRNSIRRTAAIGSITLVLLLAAALLWSKGDEAWRWLAASVLVFML